jgi:hypothetical protein
MEQTFNLHTQEHSSTPDKQGARKLRKLRNRQFFRPSRKPVLTENRNNICSKNLTRDIVAGYTLEETKQNKLPNSAYETLKIQSVSWVAPHI